MTARSPLDPEAAVQRLVELSRTALDGETLARSQGFDAFERALAEREARAFTRGRGILLGSAGFAAIAVMAVLLLLLRPVADPVLTFQVVNGALGSDGYVVGSSSGTRIEFSDGSEVALVRGTRTHIPELTAHGGRVALARGALHVKVQPLPDATWSVDAGPYTVQVTGTAFDVGWSESEKVFHLALHEGSVIVRGPLAKELKMVAGQRLSAQLEEGVIRLDDVPQASTSGQAKNELTAPALPAEREEPIPDTPSDSLPNTAGDPAPSASAVSRPDSDWQRRVARGDFGGVLEDAERRGLDRVLNAASLTELTALSDAARYARRTELAQKALLAARQRFPNSTPAREAAFFLGRLAEDRGAVTTALEWYDRYLAHSQNGVYVSQALGRKMLLVHRQHGSAAAQPLAVEYQARFPKGAYAEAAHKLAGR